MSRQRATPGGVADATPIRTLSVDELSLGRICTAARDPRSLGATLVSDARGIYALLATIDQGGMGRVHHARDERLNRSVALKVMLRHAGSDEASAQRFVEEAQITSQLEHPNIVPLHELGVDQDGHLFFTMKLVRGETLARRMARWKDQQLTPHLLYQALTIILKVLDALAFAHSRGVVHRDVKPANIMIGAYGEVLLMDWGIARVMAKGARAPAATATATGTRGAAPLALAHGSIALTTDGDIVGTPGYMAPEQARGDLAAIDHRADLYAVGAILYEILAGACPYQGTLTEMLAKAASGQVMAPSRRARGRQVPHALDAVTMKAMAPLPSDRYRSAKELAADLASYLAGRSVSARPDRPWEAIRKFVSRNLPLAITIVAAITALAVVSTLLTARILDQHRANQRLADANHTAELAAEGAQASREQALHEEDERARCRMRAFVPYAGAIDLLGRDGFVDDSLKLLRQAIALDHDFAEAHFALGCALAAAGDPAAAVPEFQAADALSLRRLGHGNPRAVLAAALAEDDCGELSGDAFSALAALGADDPYALLGRTFVAAQADDATTMMEAATRARAAEPRLWETHYAMGYAIVHGVDFGLLPHARLQQGMDELRAACAMEPHAMQPHLYLAFAMELEEEPTQAWAHELDLASALQPRNAVPLLTAATCYLTDGQMVEGRGAIERAERLSPPRADLAMVQSGYCLLTGDAERGLALAAAGARDQPIALLTGHWLLLAATLGQSAGLADEIMRFRARAQSTPVLACLEWQLAANAGDQRAALAAADTALAAAPYNGQLLLDRATSLAHLGRCDEALAAAQAAHAQMPGSAEAVRLVCALLGQLHRDHERASVLLAFAQRHPSLARQRLQLDLQPRPESAPPAPTDAVQSLFSTQAK